MCRQQTAWVFWLCILAAVVVGPASAEPLPLVGHALVRRDGSLWLREQVVRLYGIYIAPTERQCRAWIRPVRCDPRGVLELDFKVRGFVYCYPQRENDDGSLDAVCYVGRTPFREGEDLAAHLIQAGWALARPDAPFEYHALEKIARARGVGVWGYPVDTITGR